jgi:geranylgeranyl pyrophosphate synthase
LETSGLYSVYSNAISELPHGEYLQIKARKTIQKLSDGTPPFTTLLTEYFEKTHYKTGSLFTHLLRGTALICGMPLQSMATVEMLGLQLGLSFQIADDLKDVTLSTFENQKDSLNDLKEQNTTLPYLFCLLEMKEKGKIQDFSKLLGIIKNKDKSIEDLSEVLKLIRCSNAEESTRSIIHLLFKEALESFDSLSPDSLNEKPRLVVSSLPFLTV